MTAPINSASAQASPKPPAPCARSQANSITSALPATAQAQKAGRARCPIISATATAVASGPSAMMTAACVAVTLRSASASSTGKPITLPATASPSRRQCARCGQAARVSSRNAADSSPASAARPAVTKAGESCGAASVPVARRVAGSVMAKISTPSTPSQKPASSRASPCRVFMPISLARRSGGRRPLRFQEQSRARPARSTPSTPTWPPAPRPSRG